MNKTLKKIFKFLIRGTFDMTNYERLGLRLFLESENVIGTSVNIGQGSIIEGSKILGDIEIGCNCKIRQSDIIGGRVTIGNYSSLWGPNIDLYAAINSIEIGSYCSIARNVSFQEFNHDYRRFSTYYMNQNVLEKHYFEDIISKGDIVVENDVWIGAHSVVLSGAHLSTGVVVAANSVVSNFVPPYAIVGGSPARILKYRFKDDIIRTLLDLEWWTWNSVKLKSEIDNLNDLVGYKSPLK